MKTRILSTLALSGALLALPGIALAQEAETTEAKTYELKLGVEKGAKLAYEFTNKVDQDISGGMPMKITSDEKKTLTYEVMSVADDGTAKLKATYGRIQGGFSHPMMGETKWDSDDPSAQSNPASKAGVILSAKSLTASVGKNAAFTKVEGTAEALGDYATELETNPALAQAKASLSDKGQLDALRSGQIPLPTEPVAIGGKWEETRSVDMGPWTFEMTYKFELEKVEGDMAHIKTKAEGKLTETRELQPGMPPPETTLNSCLSKGTAQVSMKDGMPREITTTDTIDLVMNMMGMEIPVVITSSRFAKSVDPDEAAADTGSEEGADSGVPSPDAPAPK